MRSRRFTLALVGLGAATALTGALVVAATGASDGQVAAKTTTSSRATAADSPPCFGSADAAARWLRAGAESTCVQSRIDKTQGLPYPKRWVPCLTTADAAAHWMRESGHLPCLPVRRLP